jgi:hypothetical protein
MNVERSHNLTLLLAATLLVLSGTVAFATPKQQPVRVRVWTQAPASGFVDQDSKDRARLAGDLARKLKSHDIVLVDDSAAADVSVEITAARLSRMTGQHLTAVLSRGDYRLTIESTAGMTKSAAGSMAKKVEAWIKDNRHRLVAAAKEPNAEVPGSLGDSMGSRLSLAAAAAFL